jgi:hypothetical protein
MNNKERIASEQRHVQYRANLSQSAACKFDKATELYSNIPVLPAHILNQLPPQLQPFSEHLRAAPNMAIQSQSWANIARRHTLTLYHTSRKLNGASLMSAL